MPLLVKCQHFLNPLLSLGKTEYPKNGTAQEKAKAKMDNAAAYKDEQFVNAMITIVNNNPPNHLHLNL
mgnify:CR=1 FL=1